VNRITKKTAMWLLVALTVGASAAAADGLDERINIDLKDADGTRALQSFGQILGAKKVQIDSAIEGDLTIRLDNARVRTVMDAVCDTLGCRWHLDDGTLSFVPDPDYTPPEQAADEAADPLARPINVDLVDAPVRSVFEMFGRVAHAKVEIAPEVQGTMTVKIQDQPARAALEQICNEQHVLCELTASEHEGAVLRVTPRTKE